MIKYFRSLSLVLKNYSDGLGHLIFTNVCLHCNHELVSSEKYLCFGCWEQLKPTYFEKEQQLNELERMFRGRVKIQHACALYFYGKGTVSQSLIRALKYDFKAPLGIFLGELMAQKLNDHPIRHCDYILPVPIHPRKKFARGYNQSELLALGLSNVWQKPIVSNLAKKKSYTKSQTQLDRFGRWDNVQDIFKGLDMQIANTHILIVDDVITTGATLDALAKAIKKANPEIQISLLSFAFTK
jgi:ComF family protein